MLIIMLVKRREILRVDNLEIVKVCAQASNINKHAKRKLDIC